ncbi:MAG: hypothetical protein M2R45_05397 [Verrucomicrobia subdivision 3 bacterium]|nr:hypothetical protein [Limisphaerales bacterium]MCS1412649.1 hypothetical protein [Limisphaerales bacterium]
MWVGVCGCQGALYEVLPDLGFHKLVPALSRFFHLTSMDPEDHCGGDGSEMIQLLMHKMLPAKF